MSQILDDLGSKFLWDIVNKIQKSVQVDVEMILTALMPMLSVVIGNKAKFIGPSGTAMRVNTWSTIIANTGSRKSTTMNIIHKAILGELNKKLNLDYSKAIVKYNKLSKKDKESVKRPVKQSLYTGNSSTFEGMIKKLSYQTHGLIAQYDEANIFLTKMNKNLTHQAIATAIYEMETYYHDLVGAKGVGDFMEIDDPFMSMTLASTSQWLYEQISFKDFKTGYLNRMVFYFGNKQYDIIPFENTPDDEIRFDEFQKVSLRIWDFLYAKKEKYIFKFSKEAKLEHQRQYKIYFNQETIKRYKNIPEDIYIGTMIRLSTTVLKYAMILKIFEVFYTNNELIDNQIEKKFIDMGWKLINIHLKNLDILMLNMSSKNTIQDNFIDIIAKSIQAFLIKNKITQNSKVSISYLKNHIATLKKIDSTKCYDILKYTCDNYNVNMSVNTAGNGRETIYYYIDNF